MSVRRGEAVLSSVSAAGRTAPRSGSGGLSRVCPSSSEFLMGDAEPARNCPRDWNVFRPGRGRGSGAADGCQPQWVGQGTGVTGDSAWSLLGTPFCGEFSWFRPRRWSMSEHHKRAMSWLRVAHPRRVNDARSDGQVCTQRGGASACGFLGPFTPPRRASEVAHTPPLACTSAVRAHARAHTGRAASTRSSSPRALAPSPTRHALLRSNSNASHF